ncbi:MAG TPA: archease [Nanoarchaeota archaeon]|nr:archease [Nanoarchaeota archaeon]
MKKFEFPEPGVDDKFLAYGETLAEAFGNCALGLFAIISKDRVALKKTKNFSVRAGNKEKLLYEFLEKLLSLVDTENFLVGIVKKISITQKEDLYFLQVEVEGDSAEGYEWYMRVRRITSKHCFIKESLHLCIIQVGVEM